MTDEKRIPDGAKICTRCKGQHQGDASCPDTGWDDACVQVHIEFVSGEYVGLYPGGFNFLICAYCHEEVIKHCEEIRDSRGH
mgnify:CR=1 FL=1